MLGTQLFCDRLSEAVGPDGSSMVTTLMQVSSTAPTVANSTVSRTAGPALVVVPQPGPTDDRSSYGEVSMQPFDHLTVVEPHPDPAVVRLAARPEQMVDVGCPMNQTSISKIEKTRGRRSITVDELIAFAKVFDLPVGELVLPTHVLRSVKARQALADGQEALQSKLQAENRYNTVLRDIAVAARDDTELMETLTELRARSEAQIAADTGRGPVRRQDRPSFIRDVFHRLDELRSATTPMDVDEATT
jgi:hypothetical protein